MESTLKELWTGLVEVLTEPNDSGNTKAYTNVVARAENVADFHEHVSLVCEKYGWSLLSVEYCNPASQVEGITDEELLEVLQRAEAYPYACIFTTMHYYPSKPS